MITLADYTIYGFWFLVFLFAVILFRRTIKGNPASRFLVPAYILHAIGSISFGLIYYYYYGIGDTFGYYHLSKAFLQAVSDDPSQLGKILTSTDMAYFQRIAGLYNYRGYAIVPPIVMVAKVAMAFELITAGYYLPTCLFFGFFGFIGSWAMFRTFQKIYPTLYREFSFACLFLPSIIYWASGLSKDSLTFGALGFLIFGTYNIFFLRRRIISNALLIVVAANILFVIKAYIIVAFLPAALSWAIVGFQARIKSPALKRLFFPFTLIFLIVGFGLINQFLSSNLEQYALENVSDNMLNYKASLDTYGNAGSAYSIYSVGGGTAGFISMLIPAFITAFFRPFPWEIHNIFALLSAAESFIILFLFWRLYRRLGFKRMILTLTAEPVVLFCVLFAFIFGVAVGIASQNFGTLVRYRIPALPLFISSLFIAYYSVTGKSLWARRQVPQQRMRSLHQTIPSPGSAK